MEDRDKLNRILMEGNNDGVRKNLEYILSIVPEIKSMIGFSHKHPHHHLDVWEHTLLALSKSIPDINIRLALLLHDIGKPFSYQEDGEVRHFHGHPKVSRDIAYVILNRLEYSESDIMDICRLIEFHDTPIKQEDINEDIEFCKRLLNVQKCDALAHHPDKIEKRKKYLKEIENMINEKNKILKKGWK